MTKDAVQKQIEEVKQKQRELERELRKLENEKMLAERQEEMKAKGRSGLPPGFRIRWWYRHDPFESTYVLELEGKDSHWTVKDTPEALQDAREYAWNLVDIAELIYKAREAAEQVKGGQE